MNNVTMKLISRLPDGTTETILLTGECSESLANMKTLWEAEHAINEWSHVRAHVDIQPTTNKNKDYMDKFKT